MEWSQPETQGANVTPRGGHAGTSINGNWYIVGGGDNKSGNCLAWVAEPSAKVLFLNLRKIFLSHAISILQYTYITCSILHLLCIFFCIIFLLPIVKRTNLVLQKVACTTNFYYYKPQTALLRLQLKRQWPHIITSFI